MPNTLTVHYPEIWAKTMIKNLDAASIMLPLVNRQLETEMAGEGDVIRLMKFGNVTVDNYTAGTNVSPSTVTSTDDTLTIDQSKFFQFVIDRSEVALASNKVDLIKGYTKRGSIAMAQTIDTHLLGKHTNIDSGNVFGADSAGITLTKDNIYEYIVEMRGLIQKDNADEGDLIFVVDVDTHSLLLKSPEFLRATEMGDKVITKGMVGEVAGVRIVVSNRISTSSGVKNLMMFNKQLFCDFVMRIPPDSIETYKPELQFGTGVKCLALYGSDVFHPTAAALLKKAA